MTGTHPCQEKSQDSNTQDLENTQACDPTVLLNALNCQDSDLVDYGHDNIPMGSLCISDINDFGSDLIKDGCDPATKDKLLVEEKVAAEKVDIECNDGKGEKMAAQPTWVLCAATGVLLLANTLNYMDRYTIAGEPGTCEKK